MQRTLVWAILAVGGLGLMFYSYKQSRRRPLRAASQRQLLLSGSGLAHRGGFPVRPGRVRVRVLPAG